MTSFKSLIGFVFALMVLVLVVLGATSIVPQQYTNMSAAQADHQVDQYFQKEATACMQTGGQWIAGFAQAGCTSVYQQPDVSWYITPIDNANYGIEEFTQIALVVFAFLLAVGIATLFIWHMLDLFQKRK